jgi:hypothetical protein
MSTRREHFTVAETLLRSANETLANLSAEMRSMDREDIRLAQEGVGLMFQAAQVHATLAAAQPAASPEG